LPTPTKMKLRSPSPTPPKEPAKSAYTTAGDETLGMDDNESSEDESESNSTLSPGKNETFVVNPKIPAAKGKSEPMVVEPEPVASRGDDTVEEMDESVAESEKDEEEETSAGEEEEDETAGSESEESEEGSQVEESETEGSGSDVADDLSLLDLTDNN